MADTHRRAAPPQTVLLTDPALSQAVLLQQIKKSTKADAPDYYTELFGRMFVAYINDGLPLGVTWVPQYALLMGPKGWAEAPDLEAFSLRLARHWARFITLMPGSNR